MAGSGRRLRVCLDARLASGTSGGIEQFVIGMAAGLSVLADEDEEYLFLAYEDAADWLMPSLGPGCRLLVDEPTHHPTWRRAARRVPLARRIRDASSPARGPFRPRVPRSNGRIEREAVDVMHFTWQFGFLTEVPSIYHPHDLQHLHLPTYFGRRERAVREATYRTLCGQAAMVAVASDWVRRDVIARYGLDAAKVQVIPLASPAQIYPEPSETDLALTRSSFQLPESFILYPAQTWPHKNHLALLDALELLRRHHGLQVPLVCTGQVTPYAETIGRHARRLGLAEQVHFLGFVSPVDLVCLYRLCRAVAIPTLFEAGSFPMLEAFTLGVPVACSNVTSLPEQAGDAAIVFDPGSPEQIAEAIRRLWTDPALRATLVTRGLARIRSRTWTETARTFRAHYRRLAGRSLSDVDRALIAR